MVRYLILLLLFPTILSAQYQQNLQNQLANAYRIVGGTWIYGANETTALNGLTTVDNSFCDVSKGAVQPHNAALDFDYQTIINNTCNADAKPWDALINVSTSNVSSGDNSLFVFWTKGISDQKGTHGAVELRGEGQLLRIIPFSNTWQQWIVPVTATDNTLNIQFRVAMITQSFAIGGLAIINYNNSYTLSQLPSKDANSTYDGIAANAPWRTAAANRIDQYRKAELSIKVVDRHGTPIPNATISVVQNSHEFDFATAEKGKLMNENQSYKDDLLDYFNMVTFESDMVYDSWTNPKSYNTTKAQLCENMEWIAANNLRFRWHTALWAENAGKLPPLTSAAILENGIKAHIDEILTYPCIKDKVDEIDLLNEPVLANLIETTFGYSAAITLYKNIFDYTKTNYPAIKLFNTDYVSLDMGGYRHIAENKWKKIITDINSNSIDGIGFQAHMKFAVSPEAIYTTLNGFNAYANEFKITEFDFVGIDPSIRGQYLRDFMTIIFSHPKMSGFQMWGFRDNMGWNFYNRPIIDQNGNLKTSGQVYKDLVFTEWQTNELIKANNTGVGTLRAFKGTHLVTASFNGASVNSTVEVINDKIVQLVLPIEIDPGNGTTCEISSNGDFGQGKNDWELHENGAGFGATFEVTNGIAEVTIGEPGAASWHIQLIQRNLSLEAGKSYRVEYIAAASTPRNISVNISASSGEFTTYFHQKHGISTGNDRFGYEFTMPTTDTDVRLNFYLGNVCCNTVYFDNVQLSELNCTTMSGCDDTNISLNNTVIPPKTYKAANTLISSGTVAANTHVAFQAGASITLSAGFQTLAGGTFTATIAPCEEAALRQILPLGTDLEKDYSKASTIRLYPNPASSSVTVTYTLPKKQSTSLYLYNALGQLEEVVQPNITQDAGTHEFIYSTTRRKNGLYYVHLVLEDGVQLEKLMILR